MRWHEKMEMHDKNHAKTFYTNDSNHAHGTSVRQKFRLKCEIFYIHGCITQYSHSEKTDWNVVYVFISYLWFSVRRVRFHIV